MFRVSLFILCIVAAWAASAQAPAPDTGVLDGTIQLAPNETKKSVVLFSEASDLTTAADSAVVTIEDRTGDTVTVAFANVHVVSRVPQTVNNVTSVRRIEWGAIVSVSGLPAETTTNRTAVLRAKKADGSELGKRRISYVLSNKAAGAATVTWTMTAPGDTLMSPPNDHAGLLINVTGGPAKVSALRSTLKDIATAKKFPESALRICAGPSADRCGTPTLRPGTPTPLYLVVDEEALKGIHAGTYTGTIDVALDHAIDTKSFNLTIHRSSTKLRLLGLGIIFAGVLLSLVITMLLRNAAARTEALIPAEMLRETIARLTKTLSDCKRNRQNSPETFKALERVDEALSSKRLVQAGYVPRLISDPFRVTSAITGYADFLQKHSDRLVVLKHLIDKGPCLIETLRVQNPSPALAANFATAFKDVDLLAINDAERLASLEPQLVAIEATLRAAIGGPVRKAAALGLSDGSRTPAEQLAVRVQVINAGVWVLFAIVTTVLGYLVVIAPTFGFGTVMDLAKAFLWGLGVQTAGQAVQSLNPGTVTTAFGVQIPK